eukprot:COSAG03_NODE_19320_length_339_cov_0.370833_1_plen_84_part_10
MLYVLYHTSHYYYYAALPLPRVGRGRGLGGGPDRVNGARGRAPMRGRPPRVLSPSGRAGPRRTGGLVELTLGFLESIPETGKSV